MRLILVLALVLPAASLFASSTGCGLESAWAGCEISNAGSQIDIAGSMTIPGGSNDSGSRGGSDYFDGEEYGDGGDDSGAPNTPCDGGQFGRCSYEVGLIENPTGANPATPPDVTIADLASFRPATPTLTGQPAGFGVVGMPTNFTAAASEQQLTGTILGWRVVVNFTPAGYIFDYGDGTSQQTATGGATWEQLGQAQFTPTATSHVYRARGTYSTSVTAQYEASVNFGTGWRPVAGYVTSATSGYSVQVVEVRTALVDKTCAERPGGPGC